ncbi:bifunctional heparan sulfate N-deacetylase/N-sulfotransferase 1-like [Clavelina lepadiformis]|uniref:bifunctional heparan sulfate N-deacetylase/N-sulfotransferase 1-like n=1 Tax=Clavelina lepadiformis TaxID=159417 RepID=UPI0040437EA9
MWRKLRKIASLRKIVLALIIVSLFGLFYSISQLTPTTFPVERQLPRLVLPPASECHNEMSNIRGFDQPLNKGNTSQTRQKILVFLRDGHTQLGRDVVTALESIRFKFNIQSGEIRNLPILIDDSKGRYALIIFEDIFMYFSLHQWNREMIDKYCLDFDVGIIYFLRGSKSRSKENDVVHNGPVGTFPLSYFNGVNLKDYQLNPQSPILRIARPGEIWQGFLPFSKNWALFKSDHSTYQPVSFVIQAGPDDVPQGNKGRKSRHRRAAVVANKDFPDAMAPDFSDKLVTVVHDTGQLDGIQRVIFGSGLTFWLHKVLFLDAISYLSHGKLVSPLERYIQIDIDDVFVGTKGNRMNADDVTALVNFQDKVRQTIPGFTFQLGFSGKFIFYGNEKETEGDRLFLKVHDRFAWFPHMWSHMQAHWFNNVTELCSYMDINARFAVRHHLNTSSHYAVAPHHAGVFPVHEQLYDCWDQIWNITTTSTEEYPHLRPDHKRRGFMYRDVKNLPRQTCGLFTHTMILDKYPGGPEALHDHINGGSLFLSFLYNQFNIFMTHLSNYGNDRLAIYTFDHAINFVRCWTNLKLLQVPPETMAKKYFDLYPDELDPVWLNPCLDKRHLEIWSTEKNCNQLPDFVVVGPQKTGTTALYWYLNMHPDVKSNLPSATTFEEVQFFSGKNYFKGLDWYVSYFPIPENNTILFEKSATYFDQAVVAKRLNALLPKKPVIAILLDPAKRAYSWYQHMRSHDDNTALQHSFYEVITAKREGSPQALISLQHRCLDPGFYAVHLDNWLEHLSAKQIIIVDGDTLKDNPVRAMQDLQEHLGFKSTIDYSKLLKYEKKKGFYCQILKSGKTKCLGKSKGRQYPEMDDQSMNYLRHYYSDANRKLLQMLQSINKPIPLWVLEQVNSQH